MYIGTSGYVYKNWVGCFYPPNLSKSKFLEYYVKFFNSLELNSTFYKIPKENTLKSWKYKLKKHNLKMSLKANKAITHEFRLKNKDLILKFISLCDILENYLGAILFQLPPSLKFDNKLLEDFVSVLDNKKYAIEFRNKSWYQDKTYEILKSKNIALVWHDFKQDFVMEKTADFVYIRFHGFSGKYKGSYPEKVLEKFINEKNGFVYFNNTDDCSAPFDAIKFKKLLNNNFQENIHYVN